MNELLRTSLIWRLCAAVMAWLSGSVPGRCARALSRLWRESAIYRFFAHLLCAEPVAERSGYRRWLDRCNAGLQRRGQSLTAAAHESMTCRIAAAVTRVGSDSFFLGELFRGGMTSMLLAVVALYAPIDWLLRDILKLTAISSIWDEALMALCLVWIVVQRASAKKPLRSRANALDVWLGGYLVTGLVLLLYTASDLGVNITGFRASMQYLLLFFLVVRLLRDEEDVLFIYRLMVFAAFLIAVDGIFQFVVGVEIPSNWTDQAETAVRTRVFSIFSNPNIMGGYMILFAPMAIGMAYAVKTPLAKVFYWLCGLAMCLGCLFTMSRGAWMALAVAAVLFALIVDRKLFLVLLVGGIAACFLPFVRSRIGYLFTVEFTKSNNRGGRAMRWGTALNYVENADAWTGGLGYGIFGGAVAMQNQINPAYEYMYVDNYYVKTLTENGIVGLTALLSALASLIWNGIRACGLTGKTRMKPLCAGMLAGLVGTLVHCFFESLWEEPYMMALFFSVAAMLIFAGFFSSASGKNTK